MKHSSCSFFRFFMQKEKKKEFFFKLFVKSKNVLLVMIQNYVANLISCASFAKKKKKIFYLIIGCVNLGNHHCFFVFFDGAISRE